ncbi:MAG: DUF4160 domain-containing protein [Lachnospiraceae bacterium]|nr:DUF4160 domain-containing protein [Lachnospiraceae bacterium]
MPQVFKYGSYRVYFWANESDPLEPVHVHVSEGTPSKKATKIWITQNGKCLLSNNHSDIAENKLHELMRVIEANSTIITKKWYETFGEIRYYC